MNDRKAKLEKQKIDTKEFEFPETVFVRDIDNRVIQGIVFQCLSGIEGISLEEGNFIDNLLGRPEGIKGIHTEQDNKNHSIKIRVEIAVMYGVSIPEKAEEVQARIAEEVTRLTGLHVGMVHVVFKHMIMASEIKQIEMEPPSPKTDVPASPLLTAEEYSDVF